MKQSSHPARQERLFGPHLHTNAGGTWKSSEYYWGMLFESIYILVSAMHSEDHQEFSMPKVI